MKEKSIYTEELGELVASDAKGLKVLRYHIGPHRSGWTICRHGARRAYRVFPTRKEAIAFGKKYAIAKSAAALIIHGKDFDIEERIIFNPEKYWGNNAVRK